MMAAFDFRAIAQASVLRIVGCLMEGTLIALFAAAVLRIAAGRDAGTRFAVWFSALIAIAAFPLLSSVGMSHGANVPSGIADKHPAILVPGSWALYLFAAWAVIAGVALMRVGGGLVRLRALRKSCATVDPFSLAPELREMLRRNRRPVVLCLSDRVRVPTAIGFFNPAVVVPRWLMNELSASELNQVVLHELAHLRRWDDWTNLLQQVVMALLFFHPAVWWIERQISLEREVACDDAVLAETGRARAYAECLVRLAEKSLLRRGVALAQAAVGRVRQTSLRVAKILDANRPAGTKDVWKPAVVLVAGFAIVCWVGEARVPRMVAFQDNGQHATASAPTMAAAGSFDPVDTVAHSPTFAHAVAWKGKVSTKPIRMANARKDSSHAASDSVNVNKFDRGAVPQPVLSGKNENMVHPAGLKSVPASSEAVFVVIEGREVGSAGETVYQISVWRLSLRHPADGGFSRSIPNKT